MVDFVCLLDEYTAVESMLKLRPQVYVKGPDYRDPSQDVTGKILDEEQAVRAVGGQIFFTSDDVVFSSSSLINRFLGVFSDTQRGYLEDIRNRYGSGAEVSARLQRLAELRVRLIGDVIVDEYVYCEPLGQSLKHPLVVHKYNKEERFAGGVVAVANQVAELCRSVEIVTVLGERNSHEEFVRSRLAPNVTLRAFGWADSPTVVKRRYLYENVEQKVFEVCYIADHERLPAGVETEMTRYLTQAAEVDLVMVCDYGHGVITESVVEGLRSRGQFVAVNAQTNSANMGFNLITKKYNRLDFASVDEAEARLAVQERHEDIRAIGSRLLKSIDSRRLLITRGRNGSIGFERDGVICVAPALATQVVDRVGAGDACFAVTASCSALDMPLDLIAFVGNAVGSLAVQIVGNRQPVTAADLLKFISTLLK